MRMCPINLRISELFRSLTPQRAANCQCDCRHAMRQIEHLGRDLNLTHGAVMDGWEVWRRAVGAFERTNDGSGISPYLARLTDIELSAIVLAMRQCHCCQRHQIARPEFN